MTDTRLKAAVRLFNEARYLAAHEVLDELWEETQGERSDFYKGLIQAAICLHHLQEGNPEGAAKLYSGHRRYLAPYLPAYEDVDVEAFLASMQQALRPVLRARPGEVPVFDPEARPLLSFRSE